MDTIEPTREGLTERAVADLDHAYHRAQADGVTLDGRSFGAGWLAGFAAGCGA